MVHIDGASYCPTAPECPYLTYKAIVAVRYPELVLHDQDPIQIGHFVPHDYTVGQEGFRTVLWEVPKYSRDLLAAIEDIVVFLNYLQKCYRDLNQGATAQLLVMCNRTAVHTQLLQHGSPIGMAGLIGMAQTLAVYHYGYYTLKDRTVQFHEPKHVPSDAEAVLEWDLDTPFSSQDKPPLAIAIVVTVNGARSLKSFHWSLHRNQSCGSHRKSLQR